MCPRLGLLAAVVAVEDRDYCSGVDQRNHSGRRKYVCSMLKKLHAQLLLVVPCLPPCVWVHTASQAEQAGGCFFYFRLL